MRLRLEIKMKWHSKCNRLYVHIYTTHTHKTHTLSIYIQPLTLSICTLYKHTATHTRKTLTLSIYTHSLYTYRHSHSLYTYSHSHSQDTHTLYVHTLSIYIQTLTLSIYIQPLTLCMYLYIPFTLISAHINYNDTSLYTYIYKLLCWSAPLCCGSS